MPLKPNVVSALFHRDLLITRSYRFAFALDAFYGVLDLLLYFFISRTFEHNPASLGDAPSYFAFAAVGVILGAVLTATSTGVGYWVREEQVTGTLETVSCEPVTSFELCVGLVAFPFGFAALRACLYLGVAAGFLHLDVSNTSWIGVVLILLASGAAIAPIGILAGAAALAVKRGQMLSATLMSLMAILSGMLFPISELPGWLQPLGKILPLRFAFDGARSALFSGSGWGTDLLVLLVWAAVLWPLALFLFGRAFSFSKRAGSLAQY